MSTLFERGAGYRTGDRRREEAEEEEEEVGADVSILSSHAGADAAGTFDATTTTDAKEVAEEAVDDGGRGTGSETTGGGPSGRGDAGSAGEDDAGGG